MLVGSSGRMCGHMEGKSPECLLGWSQRRPGTSCICGMACPSCNTHIWITHTLQVIYLLIVFLVLLLDSSSQLIWLKSHPSPVIQNLPLHVFALQVARYLPTYEWPRTFSDGNHILVVTPQGLHVEEFSNLQTWCQDWAVIHPYREVMIPRKMCNTSSVDHSPCSEGSHLAKTDRWSQSTCPDVKPSYLLSPRRPVNQLYILQIGLSAGTWQHEVIRSSVNVNQWNVCRCSSCFKNLRERM